MAPPKLARDAPRLNVVQPIEVCLFPILWNEHSLAALNRFERRLCQHIGAHIPLFGEIRLDNFTRAVAIRHLMRHRLDLLDQTLQIEIGNDHAARNKTIISHDISAALDR